MSLLPIVVLLCLNMLTLGIHAARHGKPCTHDGWVVFVRLVNLHLLLWWGGWYAPLFAR